MTNLILKSKLALLTMALLTGCASIIHGPVQSVDFSSQPSGARITIDGKDYGITPKSVVLRREGRLKGEISTKKEYSVKIELDGFYPYELKVKREIDGWLLGNIVFGGIIGVIVDAGNGAMYKLTPNQVVAQLGKSSAMHLNKQDEKIYVAVTLEVNPDWEQIGTMEKIGR